MSQSGASDGKFNRLKSSMGQWDPDGASDSECNGSVGQSVFIRGFPAGLATVNSIGRWVSLYSYFSQSVLNYHGIYFIVIHYRLS